MCTPRSCWTCKYSGRQESEFGSQNERSCENILILSRDLDCGDVSDLKAVRVEVSELLEAQSCAIQNSDS